MVIFEIHRNWAKGLWGKSILRDIQVQRIAARPLKDDSVEELAKTISSIIDKKTIEKFKPLVLSIPRSHVTLRNLKFPSTDEKELDRIVSLHLTQQVPYSRDEIIYNYTILKQTVSGFTHVLLGIVHKEALRRQFSVFERLNLYPDNILLGTFGLMKFLNRAKAIREDDKGLKACLDIDADFADFAIFGGGKILFSKSISLGASQLGQPDKLSKLTGEIKQAMAVFQAEETRERPSKLYLTGAIVAQMAEIEKMIHDELQLPIETVDPVKATGSLRTVKDLQAILGKISISTLLGCASEPFSRTLNFVLPEAKLKMDMREAARNFVITGSIVIFLIVLVFLGFVGKIYVKQSYLDKLTRETYKVKNENRETMDALEKIKTVRNFTRQKDSFLYYYYRFTEILPRNITVDRLIFSKKKEFSLIGRGTAMGEIWKFVSVLKDEGPFGKIELRYSRKRRQGDKEFNEFEIICHLE